MKRILIIVVLFLSVNNGFGQNPGAPGSFSMFHTQQARTYSPGRLDFYLNNNFFTKLGEFLGTAPADFKAANWWLVAGNLSFTYGIINHLDFSTSIRFYQDTHFANEYNLPDDIFLTLKTGSYFFGRERFALAVMGTARIPTGEVHNYPFAEYASGAFEYGFKTALSYYSDPYFPDRAVHVHYNFGWWNYNENGQKIPVVAGPDREATVSSSHISMALATVIPLGEFEVRGELSGILYQARPQNFVYSAEDYAYFTPSIRYKPYHWVHMDLGIDLRISPSDRQYTSNVYDVSDRVDLPKNYPAWRVQMGVKFMALPLGRKTEYRSEGTSREVKRMLDYYDQIDAEKEKAQSIEKELQKLRNIRENADREIEELKRELEEEG